MTDSHRVRVEIDVDGLEWARAEDFVLREAISTPFDLRVTVVVPPDTDPSDLLGRDAVLTLRRADGEERTAGLVTEVSAEPAHATGASDERDARYSLKIEPALALLAMRTDSRIFQGASVPDIVSEVLEAALPAYGRSFELALRGSNEPREYCVQYQEPDLDFVQRLLADEGIHYVFDHEGTTERLLISDHDGVLSDLGTLPFEPHAHEITDREPVRSFRPCRRAAITHVELRDWNFRTSASPVGADAGEADPDLAGERREYDHGIDREMSEGRLRPRAQARHAASLVAARESSGVAQVIALRAGRRFELSGSPIAGADGRYLVTEATLDLGGVSASFAEPYACRFACIPGDLTYRPQRRRAPLVEGLETAKVVGPAGEEIHPDEHGRVKVLFPWDREGPRDDRSSCWLRVEQPWAGDGWGWMFIPRVGMDVVVEFVDGNPDKPIVTGCLYDGENLAPYPLPDEKTKSTFKTQSSPGGGGFNEHRFEDLAGQEQIFTHAQKDFDEEVLHCHTTDVGHDQTNTVDRNQIQEIGNDQTETVKGDQTMTVRSHRKVHVVGPFTETVKGRETRLVVGGSTETYGATEERLVIGGIKETVIGGETHGVAADKTEVILGGHRQIVCGASSESVSATSTTVATGGITVLTTGHARWSGASGVALQAGSEAHFVAPPVLNVMASTLDDNASTFTSMGTVSIGIYVQKGDAVGTKNDAVMVKLGFTHTSVSAWGAKAGATGLKLGKTASVKADALGLKMGFGGFKNDDPAVTIKP